MAEGFIKELYKRNSECFQGFPDKKTSAAFVDGLFDFLFIPNGIREKNEAQVQEEFSALQNKFARLANEILNDEDKAAKLAADFFDKIPGIYRQLIEDAELILRFDPASESLEEILMAYPGFFATAVYRLSHQLHLYNLPVLPRFFSEYAHSRTGIDIHPGAKIGHPFFIDHGTGIVIGETSIIGNNVKIYQGVTLGALTVAKELSETKRHPTIEDDVIIYANATILGGETVIGRGSIIGGNVWLTSGVPSNSVVYHKSDVSVKDNISADKMELNFVI